MTRARSGKDSPIAPETGAKHQSSEHNRHPRYRFATLISGAGEPQLDITRALRQLDPNQGVISTAEPRRPTVRGRHPARKEIFGDDERRACRGDRKSVV